MTSPTSKPRFRQVNLPPNCALTTIFCPPPMTSSTIPTLRFNVWVIPTRHLRPLVFTSLGKMREYSLGKISIDLGEGLNHLLINRLRDSRRVVHTSCVVRRLGGPFSRCDPLTVLDASNETVLFHGLVDHPDDAVTLTCHVGMVLQVPSSIRFVRILLKHPDVLGPVG